MLGNRDDIRIDAICKCIQSSFLSEEELPILLCIGLPKEHSSGESLDLVKKLLKVIQIILE